MPPEVLFVTKPIAPPWNDGTKNLVRDLAEALGRRGHVRPVVCGRLGAAPVVPYARTIPVFGGAGSTHSLDAADAARLLGALAVGAVPSLLHFVAAPTPRAARAARLVSAMRSLRTVQTLASAPAAEVDFAAGLFADRIVVLSRFMEARVRGATDAKVTRVAAPLRRLPRLDETTLREARARIGSGSFVIFPGDLGPDRGAELSLRAVARLPGVRLVVAARPKGAHAAAHRTALESLASSLGMRERVDFLGETPILPAYLALSDVVILPATDLSAKVDHPLVLLEAMLLERPVIVAEATPATELADVGAAIATPPDPAALSDRLRTLLSDPSNARALGLRARAHVETVHDPDRVAHAHEIIYQELMR